MVFAFYESPKTTVLAKNLLYCSTEEKVPYILEGLRVSKLTAKLFLGERYL